MSSSPAHQIEIERLNKHYGGFHALRDVDLRVPPGTFVALVGPSGCGKSTLLRTLAGLEALSSGDIRIAGTSVARRPPRQRDVAMVFQSYALYPHMTVAENMSYALRPRGRPKAEIAALTRKAAETLGLAGLLDRFPRELSGGQRQRVAMGRAIVRDPKVFLFDEPLSNLDAALRVHLISFAPRAAGRDLGPGASPGREDAVRGPLAGGGGCRYPDLIMRAAAA